jgi:glycosyltransferase involved in cell wall biosynthesis
MYRVLRIINRFNLGGITYNVSYLSRYLAARYETLLVGGPEEEGEESSLYIPHSLGLHPVVIEEMRRSLDPFSDYRAYRRIKKIIREFKPDIVHTHASKAGAIGRLAAIHCGVPVIVHTFHGHVFQGYFGPFKTRFFKAVERWLARRSNAIVAISRIQKAELSEKYRICSSGKIHVIPLGFDLARFSERTAEKRAAFRNRYSIPEHVLAIGIIGRLAPIKDHRLFIDAIAALKAHPSRPFHSLIIGDGDIRSGLEEYARTNGLSGTGSDVLTFTGWIREVDMALAGLDLVCLTSKNEGTPVSLIEAQAAGRFIVSTNVGGITDILHHGCGFLSPPGDRDAFILNLMRAVAEYETVSRQASAAKSEIAERFSYERLCREMEVLYDELLSKTQVKNRTAK